MSYYEIGPETSRGQVGSSRKTWFPGRHAQIRETDTSDRGKIAALGGLAFGRQKASSQEDVPLLHDTTPTERHQDEGTSTQDKNIWEKTTKERLSSLKIFETKEKKFQRRYTKYLKRASELQKEDYYIFKYISKTSEGINKIAEWIADNEGCFNEPTSSYRTNREKFKSEKREIASIMSAHPVLDSYGNILPLYQREFNTFKDAAVEFLKEIHTRLQPAQASSSTQAGPST